jgi:hypothetical protein
LHADHISRIVGEVFTVMKKAPNKIQVMYVVHISAESNAATNIAVFEAIQKVNISILSDITCFFLNYALL